MVNLMDGIMRALAKKNTQWKEDLYFATKVVRQKLSKYYAEVTRTTGLLLDLVNRLSIPMVCPAMMKNT